MVDFSDIYQNRAEEYHRMVSHEDYEGNLPAALHRLLPLKGARVLDLGSGTGRLTKMLASQARAVHGVDRARPMLKVAKEYLCDEGIDNWSLVEGDIRDLPFRDGCADIVVAGWAMGHFVEWFPENWKQVVDGAVAGMRRVVSPGGSLLILETLGTGRTEPEPPVAELGEYYAFLEQDLEFSRSWVRTDFAFESPEQGAEAIRFFFGDELAERLLKERSSILPECTGLWLWRK